MSNSRIEEFYYQVLCSEREYCNRDGKYIYKPLPLAFQAIVVFLLFLLFACFLFLIVLVVSLLAKLSGVPLITFAVAFVLGLIYCYFLNKKFTRK